MMREVLWPVENVLAGKCFQLTIHWQIDYNPGVMSQTQHVAFTDGSCVETSKLTRVKLTFCMEHVFAHSVVQPFMTLILTADI